MAAVDIKGRWGLVALALLMAFATLAYWPGLDGGFIFDDFPNIVFNASLHVHGTAWQDWLSAVLSTETGPLQRPLAMLRTKVQST